MRRSKTVLVALLMGIAVAAALLALVSSHNSTSGGTLLSFIRTEEPTNGGVQAYFGIAPLEGGNILCVYPTETGGESAVIADGRVMGRQRLAGYADTGDLASHWGGVTLVLPDNSGDGPGLKYLLWEADKWAGLRSIPCDVAGVSAVAWPRLVALPSGEVDVLCFLQTPGGVQEKAGLYAVRMLPQQGRWEFLRKGIRGVPLGRHALPDARFAYWDTEGWWLAVFGKPPDSDVRGPASADGEGAVTDVRVLDACTDASQTPWVLWSGRAAGRGSWAFLSNLRGGKWATDALPVRMTSDLTARLVCFRGDKVAVVGVDADSGDLVVCEYSGARDQWATGRLVGSGQLPRGAGIDQLDVAVDKDGTLHVEYKLEAPHWRKIEFWYKRFPDAVLAAQQQARATQ